MSGPTTWPSFSFNRPLPVANMTSQKGVSQASIGSEQEDRGNFHFEHIVGMSEAKWIDRLLHKLPNRNPVRNLVTEIRTGVRQTLPFEFLSTVLRDRSPKKWRERAIAAWVFGTTPIARDQIHDATLLLSDVLEGRFADDRVASGCLRSYIIASFICFIGAIISMICSVQDLRAVDYAGMMGGLVFLIFGCAIAGIPVGLAVALFVMPIYVTRDKRRLNCIRASAARSLKMMDSPHAIASLAEAARNPDREVRESAYDSLVYHLPRLNSKHYGALSRATVPNLCSLLPSKDIGLQIKVLEALTKIGDGRALEPVLQIQRSTINDGVRGAADRAVSVVSLRADNEKSAALLLRASATPAESEGVLLRPAGATPDLDESVLLRPTVRGEK